MRQLMRPVSRLPIGTDCVLLALAAQVDAHAPPLIGAIKVETALERHAKKGRGGARKGAGRKRGSTKTTMTFKLERSTLELLRARVPRGAMTPFVERALLHALDELDAKTSL
jgi:hypothetical protein